MNQERVLLEKVMFPMLVTSKKSRKILYANPYAQKQYDIDLESLVGSSIDQFYVHKEQKNKILEAFDKNGTLEHLELEFKTSKGKIFTGLLSLTEIMFDSKECYLGMVFDISKQKKQQEELKQANHKLHILATTDPMTGANNRRNFFEVCEPIVEKAHKNKTKLSVLMLDIDKFKNVNDTYGHATGDEVIKLFSKTIKKSIRKKDIFARFGGEEFAVVLPSTGLKKAQKIANKIRKNVQKLSFIDDNNKLIRFTVSVGVATISDNSNLENLLKKSDDGLYKAKENGRNRVEVG